MDKRFTISNLITVFRLLLIPFIVYFLLKKERLIAFIIMLVSLFSDVLDGYIARKFNQESKLGRLLDPLCDKISLTIILLTLLLINAVPLWAVIMIAVRDILILIGSYLLFKQKKVVYKSNIFGKITGFLFGLMILAFALEYRNTGMVFLYISIPFMLAAFITYFQRYILEMRKAN